jgi:hypothetical protein
MSIPPEEVGCGNEQHHEKENNERQLCPCRVETQKARDSIMQPKGQVSPWEISSKNASGDERRDALPKERFLFHGQIALSCLREVRIPKNSIEKRIPLKHFPRKYTNKTRLAGGPGSSFWYLGLGVLRFFLFAS